MIRCISITNPRVLEIYEKTDKKSKLIEDAILFYVDNKLTKEDIKKVIQECLSNLNITSKDVEINENDILDILKLGGN